MSENENPQVTISPDEIRDALKRIECSETVGGSERLCRFLRYSVEAALDGRSKDLNQYEIGLNVFDKPSTFDPTVDPIVRVEAARLRDKLDLYYSDEGAVDAIRIRFASRGYSTRFERCVEAPAKVRSTERGGDSNTRGPDKGRNSRPEPAKSLLDGDGPVSVAVLPFLDLSPGGDQQTFCDGVTVELINQLATVHRMRLVSRSLSYRFKGEDVDVLEAGRAMGVDALLEGSVRRYPEGSRFTAQLSDATDGFLLWAGTYTVSSDQPLAMQSEVVESIRKALNAMLQRRQEEEPPSESAGESAVGGESKPATPQSAS